MPSDFLDAGQWDYAPSVPTQTGVIREVVIDEQSYTAVAEGAMEERLAAATARSVPYPIAEMDESWDFFMNKCWLRCDDLSSQRTQGGSR
jgi:hypothetical protein